MLVDLALLVAQRDVGEANHLLLFKASLDWLTTGEVGGTRRGEVKLGYPKS